MVVSLYVCEIPNNVTKEDIDNLFSEIEGYIETRTKVANDKRTIAFIDYQTEKDAKCARATLQGFKFTDKDKGLIIKISDNTKGGQSQNFHSKPLESNRKFTHNKRHRDISHSNSRDDHKQTQNNTSVSPNSNPSNIDINSTNLVDFMSNVPASNIPGSTGNPLPNFPGFQNPQKFLKMVEATNSLGLPNPSSKIIPGQNLDNTTAPSTLPPQNNFVSNLQTLQLLCQLQKIGPQKRENNNRRDSSSRLEEFSKYDDELYAFEHFNQMATKIVYVEGIPYGATEREIAHIFRPFPGFQNIRIIPKEKNGKKTIICFVDFENIIQSTLCIQTLQGYRFDKNDIIGLHFSYGISKNSKK